MPLARAGCAVSLAAAVMLVAPGLLDAQLIGAGARYQTYVFDEPAIAGAESVSLQATPVGVNLDLHERFSLSIGTAFAKGIVTGPNGVESTLSGITDTEVGFTVRPGPSWLLVSGNATIPTGAATLTTAESYVAAYVAAQLLPFAIGTWGTGGSAGGSVSVARQLGAWGVGFSAGYRLAQAYEPIPDLSFQYRPGNAMQFRIALDRNVSSSGTLSVLAGFQAFAEDEGAGTNLFQSGSRLQGVVSYAFALGRRNSGLVYAGLNHRSAGFALPADLPFGGIVDSPSQQLFMGGTNLRLAIGRASAVLPRAELMVYRTADGKSQGWVGTFGPEVELRVAGNSSSSQFIIAPSGLARVGNVIVEEGAESSFLGWEAGLTFRLVPGR